jgi:hypothetical protein
MQTTNGYHRIIAASTLLLLLTDVEVANGQHATANQMLTIEVRPVTSLLVTEDPRPLVITSGSGATGVQSVTDRSTQYSLVTNVANMRISASIDREMPSGTSLKIKLGSTIGRSKGEIDISKAKTPVDVVTGITRGGEQRQDITYTFIAESSVKELPPEGRQIILTLTN